MHGMPTARGSRLWRLLGLAAETPPPLRPQNVDPSVLCRQRKAPAVTWRRSRRRPVLLWQ